MEGYVSKEGRDKVVKTETIKVVLEKQQPVVDKVYLKGVLPYLKVGASIDEIKLAE